MQLVESYYEARYGISSNYPLLVNYEREKKDEAIQIQLNDTIIEQGNLPDFME